MSKGVSSGKKTKQTANDYTEIFNQFKKDGHFLSIGKVLGKGSFGEVREVLCKNKIMAAKISLENNEKAGEIFSYDLKGRNIIKINKIHMKEINHKKYYLIIMEKAILRDLGKLSDFYHNHNLLKLIYKPFDEDAGDNLVRFYALQILNAMEALNRSYLVHFDLKPENLLITLSLIIKLSDFSLLRKIADDEKEIKIPGGTNGYLTMEYFQKKDSVSSSVARKQDYFAFGATLFFIKYGELMLKYKKNEDAITSVLTILDKLQYRISKIRANVFTDEDFIKLLESLIAFSPEERPNFEQIYRNKWINRNLLELNDTFSTFEYDEEKLIIELQKNDYLIEKEKEKKEKNNNITRNKYRFKKKLK